MVDATTIAGQGQGSASITDVVTALQGLTSQVRAGNTQLAAIQTALAAINFPENVSGYTVATLPTSPTIGALAYVTDGAGALAWGNAVTGGGSTKYLVWWTGSAWHVFGA